MNSLLSALRCGPLRVLALAVVFALLASGHALAQTARVYVKQTAPGPHDGLSWATAYTTLEPAIALVSPGGEIWCAAGNYVPADPIAGFSITKRLKLYGGFRGNETSLATRQNWYLQTILNANNGATPVPVIAEHVVSIQQVPGIAGAAGVVIDGFLIVNGNCINGTNTSGGGITSHCSDLDLANCFIRSNKAQDGGGLFFDGGCFGQGHIQPPIPLLGPPDTLHIKSCEFKDNFADLYGGGIYGAVLNGETVNTQFLTNSALGKGGGVYLERMGVGVADQFNFTNCVYWGNFTTYSGGPQGGGICLGENASSQAANSWIVNCSFAVNYNKNYCANTLGLASAGPAVFVSAHSLGNIYNSILYFNYDLASPCMLDNPIGGVPTVEYSDVEGGFFGTGNKLSDPKFRYYSTGSLTLLLASPCIDAADYSRLPLDNLDVNGNGNTSEVLPIDVFGNVREVDVPNVYNGGVPTANPNLDMGAYERP